MRYRHVGFGLLGLAAFVFLPLISAHASSNSGITKIREDITVQSGETVDQVHALLGSVQVEGTVRDHVISLLGNITVGKKGVIQGNAISIGGKVIREKGSRVKGQEVSFGLPLKNIEKLFFLAIPVAASIGAVALGMAAIFTSLGFIALVIVVLTLFEKQVNKAQQTLRSHAFKSLGLGLFGFCCLVPVLVFLTITIIGIPLAFFGLAVAGAALVLGVVSVGTLIGNEVAKRLNGKLKTLWAGLLGVIILFLISLIPLLGPLVELCVLFFGFGAVIQTRFKA